MPWSWTRAVKQPGTEGVFDFLQKLVDTFDFFWKLVDTFDFFWKLVDTFEFIVTVRAELIFIPSIWRSWQWKCEDAVKVVAFHRALGWRVSSQEDSFKQHWQVQNWQLFGIGVRIRFTRWKRIVHLSPESGNQKRWTSIPLSEYFSQKTTTAGLDHDSWMCRRQTLCNEIICVVSSSTSLRRLCVPGRILEGVFCERVLDVPVRWGGEKIVHQDEHDERRAYEHFQHFAFWRKRCLEWQRCSGNSRKMFQHVDHSDYHSLWNCVLRVRSVIATTVSCEQRFSCLKQSKHANIKIDNLCKIVDYRLSIKDSYGLKRKKSGILNRKKFSETDQRVLGVDNLPVQEPSESWSGGHLRCTVMTADERTRRKTRTNDHCPCQKQRPRRVSGRRHTPRPTRSEDPSPQARLDVSLLFIV